MLKKIRIGISFFWGDSYNDIWSNGAGQNMFFLKELLSQIDFVEEVFFVYWRNDISKLDNSFKKYNSKFYNLDDVIDDIDILIEGTLILEENESKLLENKNVKVISYRMGNDFIMDMEKFVFEKTGGRAFNNSKYHAIWMNPQHVNTNKYYLEIMKNIEIDITPHLWHPMFLEDSISKLDKDLSFGFKKIEKGARISVLEPNCNVVKTCYNQILISELLYKNNPELIKHVYLCNTYDKRNLSVFHNFIGYTKLVKNNIMTVEKRHKTPYFLSKYTDVVLVHQWENALNYVYYEALYGNYPLVHNSELLPDGIGYFYAGFDAKKGKEALEYAIINHNNNLEKYSNKVKVFLETLSPYNKENIYIHKNLIKKLYKGEF